ncbi:hypothetical protein [Bradyrhizobium sp. USDA 10063]
MLASEAARIFRDWAVAEGLMPDNATITINSTPAEMALIQPVSDAGRQALRSKEIEAIVFANGRDEITILTKRAAPSKRMIGSLPATLDNVKICYRQGAQDPIGGDMGLPFAGPAYVVRSAGGRARYTCGSSISVGNCRDAGTLGALVRDQTEILYGLTNNHVSGACNFAAVGLPIIAPGVCDVAPNNLPPFTVGFHSRSLPIIPGSADNISAADNLDAAIFRIGDEANVSSFQGDSYDTPVSVLPFFDGIEVEKVGRTTGHTRGRVLGQIIGPSPIKFEAVIYGFTGLVFFEPLWMIVGQGALFSDNGDSGSLITTVVNGQRFAVGIVVGGKHDGSAPGGKVTLALPILPILQKLGVSLIAGHNL